MTFISRSPTVISTGHVIDPSPGGTRNVAFSTVIRRYDAVVSAAVSRAKSLSNLSGTSRVFMLARTSHRTFRIGIYSGSIAFTSPMPAMGRTSVPDARAENDVRARTQQCHGHLSPQRKTCDKGLAPVCALHDEVRDQARRAGNREDPHPDSSPVPACRVPADEPRTAQPSCRATSSRRHLLRATEQWSAPLPVPLPEHTYRKSVV